MQQLSDDLDAMYKDRGITKVVGIESRGFIMGPILATRLNAGFVPIRKPGQVPAETKQQSYNEEDGTVTIESQQDTLNENDGIVVHDDLLTTGVTMAAACEVVQKRKPKKVYINVLIELGELDGRSLFGDDVEVESLITV